MLNVKLKACVENGRVVQLIQRFDYVAECTRKTKELVNDKCGRMESKRKKLLRSQTKEKNRALEMNQAHGHLEQLTKV